MSNEVQRYHAFHFTNSVRMDPHPFGEWVRYDDIKHLLVAPEGERIAAADKRANDAWAASRMEQESTEYWRGLTHEAFLQLEYLHQRERKHSSTEAMLLRLSQRLGIPLDASTPQLNEEPQ